MKGKSIVVAAIAFLMVGANIASADLIQGIFIDFVTIGNPGNPGDTRTGTNRYGEPLANPYGCGAVSYEFRIGKYEVTNAQWEDFVRAAGSPTGNPSYAYDQPPSWPYYTGANKAANGVSWYEAAQFCNYLTSGDKSQGAYQFSGDNTNPGDFEGIDRDSAVSTYETVYVSPTHDEWYKAAYYTGSGYSTYANGTDIAPIAGVDTNYHQDYPYSGPWDVGSGTQEQNGTFDMMGNVCEWNETLIESSSGINRVLRGGRYNGFDIYLWSCWYNYIGPGVEGGDKGFRVASIPEPATLLLLGLGSLMLRRRRQA